MRVDGDVGVLEEVEFRAVAVPREQRVWLAMRRTVQEDITSDDHSLLTFETGSVDVRRLCNSQGHLELMDRAVYIKPVYVLRSSRFLPRTSSWNVFRAVPAALVALHV